MGFRFFFFFFFIFLARWHPERENWCLIRVYQATRFINIVFTKPMPFRFFFFF